MKKILSFFGICFSLVGCLGGIGYACHCKAWFIAACIAFLGWVAYPRVKVWVDELING